MSVKNLILVAEFTSGEKVINPGFDTIKWFMSRPYDTYWLYAPTAILSWQRVSYEMVGERLGGKEMVGESVDKKYQLTLIKHKRIGWFCLHSRENKSSVPFPSSGDKTNWIEHWLWGDTMFFLRDCFIKRSECDDVVETFVKNGGKSKTVKWKPLSQITPYAEQPPKNASRVVTVCP